MIIIKKSVFGIEFQKNMTFPDFKIDYLLISPLTTCKKVWLEHRMSTPKPPIQGGPKHK